jgi:hypothetical protein
MNVQAVAQELARLDQQQLLTTLGDLFAVLTDLQLLYDEDSSLVGELHQVIKSRQLALREAED